MHTESPMPQALDSAVETEVPVPVTTVTDTFREQLYHTTEAPNLQNLTMHTNSNFLSSIFEIGESSTAREDVIILDDRVILGRGPSSFVIHGELHHQIGALLPNQGQEAMYAQLYIYNPSEALHTRQRRNPHLRRDVLKIIEDTLLQSNPFCELYRRAYVVLEDAAGEDENFYVPTYLHYNASTDHRKYNLPSIDEIIVILPGDGSKISSVRDTIFYLKAEQGLMRISECHPAYLPLHYVLLFPTGQLGWSIHLKN
ncbi:hypothetical protein GIB67_015629 [Kingdonia uniflora]|uniref:Helitron helicase-like domain-containing protein n=1 Tax=Kingdonia uniflora TaxID=39325 RepID=A0A7J7NTZ8_9MAGN|nr:hypothetical protein GIB67_015629 [Kingdonia uniflora]